jgi:hypothetical protein
MALSPSDPVAPKRRGRPAKAGTPTKESLAQRRYRADRNKGMRSISVKVDLPRLLVALAHNNLLADPLVEGAPLPTLETITARLEFTLACFVEEYLPKPGENFKDVEPRQLDDLIHDMSVVAREMDLRPRRK